MEIIQLTFITIAGKTTCYVGSTFAIKPKLNDSNKLLLFISSHITSATFTKIIVRSPNSWSYFFFFKSCLDTQGGREKQRALGGKLLCPNKDDFRGLVF